MNQSRLAASLAVSAPAIGRYIDLLVDSLLDLETLLCVMQKEPEAVKRALHS